MKVCPNCNLRYEDIFAFCKKCGSKLEFEEEKKFCPSCGKEIKIEGEFCPYCGASLKNNDDKINDLHLNNNNPVNNNTNNQIINDDISGEKMFSPGCLFLATVIGIIFLLFIAIFVFRI